MIKMARFYNKYRNKKIENKTFGKFDSKHEYNTFLYLLALQQNGDISELKRQVAIDLTPNKPTHKVRYIADFTYKDKENGLIIADAKGIPTAEYRIKREWLLNEYKGFRFIEYYKDFVKEFEAIGYKDIVFLNQ